jgi:hypothetical protein
MMALMSSFTQRLLDDFPTARTVLAGVVRWNRNCCHPEHLAKVFQPVAESRPCSISQGLSQFPVSDHVSHLQILVGNQVVGLDYASCQLDGKIFTLPTYFEVLPAQMVSCLTPVFRTFLGSRETTTKTFERFLGLSEMTGVFLRVSIRIGVEVAQTNIQADSFTRWFSFLNSLNIKTKLNVVPVSATNNPNPFDLTQLAEVQITSSPQLKTSGFEAISESNGSSVFRKLGGVEWKVAFPPSPTKPCLQVSLHTAPQLLDTCHVYLLPRLGLGDEFIRVITSYFPFFGFPHGV